MARLWNLIKQKILNENGILSIGFSDIVGSGISAIFWLYIASVIDPGEYGEIHYFLGIAGMAQIFSMIGNAHVLTVYSAKKEKIQSTLFILSIIPTIISSIIIIVILSRIDSALLVFGYVIFESVNSVLLGRKYYRRYAKMILIQKSLTIILGISFFYIFGASGIIFALVLTFIPYFTIFIKEFQQTKIDFSLLKEKKNFIINNYLMTISGSFGGQIDKIILAPLLGFTLLGNYSLALQIFTILVIFSSIIFKFLLPQDASGISNKKIKKITILISIVISIIGITIVPKIIPVFFTKFIGTIDAISIMSFAVVPETITMLYMSKMLGQEKSRFILIAKLISLIIIVIGFILVGPIYGIIGLATILVIASVSQTGFLVISDKISKGGKNVR
jgi:O-antigen/teichoic acid export membrane protein|tara:strand:+ start:767 stop:1936 length:1170 start_codon:yes stop_codon:yes gene_type:complete